MPGAGGTYRANKNNNPAANPEATAKTAAQGCSSQALEPVNTFAMATST
jgi:hypothetical protein